MPCEVYDYNAAENEQKTAHNKVVQLCPERYIIDQKHEYREQIISYSGLH
jgi:hypothetical protein